MKLKAAWILTLLMIGEMCHGALPPLWSSVNEIEGILRHPELNNYLDNGQIINKIERIPGGFLVITSNTRLFVEVRVKSSASPRIGPAEFEYTFYKK